MSSDSRDQVPPIQQLDVVARLFPLVERGEKTSTIRWRERTIVPGMMRYVCADDRSRTVDVMVTRCVSMPLADVAAYQGREAEWPDAVMLEGMREHYPDITLADVVDVVEHRTPQESHPR